MSRKQYSKTQKEQDRIKKENMQKLNSSQQRMLDHSFAFSTLSDFYQKIYNALKGEGLDPQINPYFNYGDWGERWGNESRIKSEVALPIIQEGTRRNIFEGDQEGEIFLKALFRREHMRDILTFRKKRDCIIRPADSEQYYEKMKDTLSGIVIFPEPIESFSESKYKTYSGGDFMNSGDIEWKIKEK